MKLEIDDDSALGSNGGENSLISPSGLPNPGAKPKAPRVKREKKEPGNNTVLPLHLTKLSFKQGSFSDFCFNIIC